MEPREASTDLRSIRVGDTLASMDADATPVETRAGNDSVADFRAALQRFTHSPSSRTSSIDSSNNTRVARSTHHPKSATITKAPSTASPDRKRVRLHPSPSSPATPSPATSGLKRRNVHLSNATPLSPSPSRGKTPVNHLTDALAPNLHILFVGVNPGLQTAATGFAYAHPSNRFYPLLHIAGITPHRAHPSEYHSLVTRFGLGHTNVVTRPTRDASQLSKTEMEDGVAAVEFKVRKWKPGCVCLVGKGVWEAVERVWKRKGRRWGVDGKGQDRPFEYGWQDAYMGHEPGVWEGAPVFAATSSSGLAAGVSWAEKVRIWTILGDWLAERRRQSCPELVEADAETAGPREHEIAAD